jgi:ribosomal protein S18 acetylase RimI-like enzyme
MPQKKVRFSKPEPSDYLGLVQLLETLDSEFFPPLSTRRPLEEYLGAFVEHGAMIQVTVDGKPAGFVGYFPGDSKERTEYDKVPFVRYIGVVKEHRRAGLGRMLMERCFDDLELKGLRKETVQVRTWSTNVASNALYLRLGFEPVETWENDRAPGVHSVFYERPVDLGHAGKYRKIPGEKHDGIYCTDQADALQIHLGIKDGWRGQIADIVEDMGYLKYPVDVSVHGWPSQGIWGNKKYDVVFTPSVMEDALPNKWSVFLRRKNGEQIEDCKSGSLWSQVTDNGYDIIEDQPDAPDDALLQS